MNIIYRPIVSYNDLYAGTDGSIIDGGRGCELKPSRHNMGYLQTYIPEIKRQKLTHRLIAEAFLGPCPAGMEVRHADGTRTNNQPSNLCYGSTRDNAQDAMRHGTHQGAAMSAKTKCSRGHEYSLENTYIHPTTGSRHCRTCRTDYLREYNARPENRARRRENYRKTHSPESLLTQEI